ncbi:hypothetical protein FQA39_LY09195 [Lamprigera yunnana]|nr:hypothetical protein FQA39_LY09195 [Lamprigera yunnana]
MIITQCEQYEKGKEENQQHYDNSEIIIHTSSVVVDTVMSKTSQQCNQGRQMSTVKQKVDNKSKRYIVSAGYRRTHKKGQKEEATSKRTRRTQKCQRAIVGASLNDIMAKKNQKPEVRKAQREQAIRAAKEQKKSTKVAKKVAKKATAPPKAKLHQKTKAAKITQKAAPKVGGKR